MTTMYDAVEWDAIPTDAEAVLGYINGAFAWPAEAWARFPAALHVRCQIFIPGVELIDDGDVLDIEGPDANTPAGRAAAVAWARMRPGKPIYTSAAMVDTLAGAIRDAGLEVPRFGVADWTGRRHLVEGSAFTQYANPQTSGGNYDLSELAPDWPGSPAPPAPQPKEDDEMALYATNSSKTGFVIATDLSEKKGIPDGQDAANLLATGAYHEVALSDEMLDLIPGT